MNCGAPAQFSDSVLLKSSVNPTVSVHVDHFRGWLVVEMLLH